MSESILAKYMEGNPSPGPQGAKCINFIRKKGDLVAMMYAHMVWANLDPSKGLQIHFSTHTATLIGRNLRPLYDALLRQELSEVQEKDEKRDVSEEGDTVVTQVHIRQVPDGESVQFKMPSDVNDGH